MIQNPSTFEMLKDIGIPLVSAVVGALAGGILPWFLANRASKEQLERDRVARTEAELSEARQVFVKLMIITNEIGSFNQQIETMIAQADASGNGHMPTWQRISTFAGIERSAAVEFVAGELAVFIAADAVDYVDDLILLSRRHAAVLASLATFAELKTQFHYEFAQHGTSSRDASGVSTTSARVPTEMANYFRLKAGELDLFADNMRQLLNDYALFGEQVAGRFGPIVEARFGKGRLPGIEPIFKGATAAWP